VAVAVVVEGKTRLARLGASAPDSSTRLNTRQLAFAQRLSYLSHHGNGARLRGVALLHLP
jgi:hypothetical protein